MGQDGDLQGCRIVVTRPVAQASELAEPLRALGAQVRVRPLVGIAPPADPSGLRSALDSLASFQWIAFTSANAVRACVAAAAPGTHWPQVACVGAGTARAAAAAGIPVSLVPESFSGDALARALVREQSMAGVRVLWPRASGAREAFATLLREAGAEVTEVECYRTSPDPGAAAALAAELRTEPADLVLFTSPSAVVAYQSGVGLPPGGAVAVIGGVTGEAVAQAGWEVAVRPVEQSIAGLIAALRQWWGQRRD